MSRHDLLALSPESLASLANLGLVKRAQRELAEGGGPSLEEQADGTVIGTFKDGVIARLPRDTPLKEAPCSCGSASVCRHRVAVALAYPAFARAAKRDDGPPDSAPPADWSPGEIDDATLARVVGEKTLERSRAARKKGLVVTVERDGTPTAKLPSCTVRFLVPHDVAYARCDCAQGAGGCEHLALAVWAFRLAASDARTAVVSLGEGVARAPSGDTLDSVMSVVFETLRAGVAEGRPPASRFAELRAGLEREGVTWIHELVVDLEVALDGYHARSARFGAREIARLLCELGARTRAGRREGRELPPRFVLGQDEAPETRLDHVRLVSLGLRLSADDRTRMADVFLADPDTTLVLVLRKRWDFPEGTAPDDGPLLGRRSVATGVRLEALAQGQLASKVVKRRANRSIELGSSRAAQTSVTPQRGDFESLPSPLLIRDLAEHHERRRTLPPRMLRPRVLAEEVHAIEVSSVVDVRYSAAEQRLFALLRDAAGNPFEVVSHHRRVAPHALEAVAAALAGKVRFVAGELSRRANRWTLDPLSISSDSFVVPDLGAPRSTPIATGSAPGPASEPIELALQTAEASLDELCHTGLAAPPRAVLGRLSSAAQKLEDTGLAALAARLRRLESTCQSAPTDAPQAWVDAAIRLTLTRDA